MFTERTLCRLFDGLFSTFELQNPKKMVLNLSKQNKTEITLMNKLISYMGLVKVKGAPRLPKMLTKMIETISDITQIVVEIVADRIALNIALSGFAFLLVFVKFLLSFLCLMKG